MELRPLLREVERRYGIGCGASSPLTGGEDGLLWRVAAAAGPVVVRLDPPERSLEEVLWIQQVASLVARRTGLAPAALEGHDGSCAFVWRRRVVSVTPFTPGVPLDPTAAGCLEAAAAVLARLHAVLAEWHGPESPRPSPWAPSNWPPDQDPPAVVDRSLDRWLEEWRNRLPRQDRHLIHGDFFPGNLIWRDGKVAAVIDWHETRADAQVAELASAIWEFARQPGYGDLDRALAGRFLTAYRQAGGTAGSGREDDLVPLMRCFLRLQIRYSRSGAARDLPGYREHVESLTRAFERLRSTRL